jgi:hypothetical protein
MSDQQELRQRREALAQAVNRHDLEAVRSFIHPTFVGKTKQGFSIGYKEMVPMVELLFAPGKDYQETVEIEEIEVSGDSAKLVTRRTERGRFHDPKRVDVANGVGLFLPPQQNLWVRSGSGRRPRLWSKAIFAISGVRKP